MDLLVCFVILLSFSCTHLYFSTFQILEALNKGEIPSTGSLVEVFNKGILERCLKLYNERMAKVRLPLPEQSLQDAHERSKKEAMDVFDVQHFGRQHAKKSVMQLDEEIQEVLIADIYPFSNEQYEDTYFCSYTKLRSVRKDFQTIKSLGT